MYRFYLKKGEHQMLLPVTPSELTVKTGSCNKTVYILNLGEMNLPRKAGLREIRFRALIPSEQYSFVQIQELFVPPVFFLGFFREIKQAGEPVQLLLFRSLADGREVLSEALDVLLEEYTVSEYGGEQGDFWVDFVFKEYRAAKSIRYAVTGGASPVLLEQGILREQKQPASVYTVKRGDTLWMIAKRELGDGRKYRELAQKNGIGDPNRIYVGQVLKL